jgi:hypothetical protein
VSDYQIDKEGPPRSQFEVQTTRVYYFVCVICALWIAYRIVRG